MSRPDFPNPYCILPANVISRIISDQAVYDENPEKWEREERLRKEEREREEYERQSEEQGR